MGPIVFNRFVSNNSLCFRPVVRLRSQKFATSSRWRNEEPAILDFSVNRPIVARQSFIPVASTRTTQHETGIIISFPRSCRLSNPIEIPVGGRRLLLKVGFFFLSSTSLLYQPLHSLPTRHRVASCKFHGLFYKCLLLTFAHAFKIWTRQ